jgi:hypothetical protein
VRVQLDERLGSADTGYKLIAARDEEAQVTSSL